MLTTNRSRRARNKKCALRSERRNAGLFLAMIVSSLLLVVVVGIEIKVSRHLLVAIGLNYSLVVGLIIILFM